MVTVGGGIKSGRGRDSRRRGNGKGVRGPDGVREWGWAPGGRMRRRLESGLEG
jgi:hypothetical protein